MRRLKQGVGTASGLMLTLLALALCIGAAAQQTAQQQQPAAAVIPVVPVVPVQTQTISQPQAPQLQQTAGMQAQQPQTQQQPSSVSGSYTVQPAVHPLVVQPVSAAAPLGDAVYRPPDQYQQQQQQQGPQQQMSIGLSSADKAAVMQAHKVSAAVAGSAQPRAARSRPGARHWLRVAHIILLSLPLSVRARCHAAFQWQLLPLDRRSVLGD